MMLTRNSILAWFAADGWRLLESMQSVERRPLIFRTGRDMPEGFWLEAQVELGFHAHRLRMYVRAFDGCIRRLHEIDDVSFHDELELASMVAQLGPKSFGHIIERFRREVMDGISTRPTR